MTPADRDPGEPGAPPKIDLLTPGLEAWLGVVASFTVYFFVGSLLLTQFDVEPANESAAELARSTEAQMWVQLGASLTAILFALLWRRNSFGWRSDRPIQRVLASYPLFLLGFVPVAFIGYPALLEALDVALPEQDSLSYFGIDSEHRSTFGFATAALAVCVVGPIAEEVLFRGYVQGFFRRILPKWPAILVTAGLFGLMHGFVYALPTALLGAWFGWMRERSGGLTGAALAHIVHNSLTVGLRFGMPWLFDPVYSS